MPMISLGYIAAIAILMAILSTRVAVLRGMDNVALGAGSSARLFLAQRQFGNLAEYAGVILLLLVVMELRGIDPVWLHAYGGSFLALRLIHPIALFDRMEAPAWQKAGRFVAALGTAILLVVGAVAILMA